MATPTGQPQTGGPGMNLQNPGMQGPGGGMQPSGPGQMQMGQPGQPQAMNQQQAQQQQQQQIEQQKLDNISKSKQLVPHLKDSLMDVFRVAAVTIQGNYQIDVGSKPAEVDLGRFDKTLEKFFSTCDQLEMNLKTAIECVGQESNAKRYLSTPVTPQKMDGSMTYPQYLNIVQSQIAYAKEVHNTLMDAAQKLSTDM